MHDIVRLWPEIRSWAKIPLETDGGTWTLHLVNNLDKMKKKYWIEFHEESCPVCGRGQGEFQRIRRYNEKPKEHSKRYTFTERYDYCNS